MKRLMVAPIVEGHGEVESVPILLRRVYESQPREGTLAINNPVRVRADKFKSSVPEFRKYIELASAKVRQFGSGAVIVMLDCDDDCPAVVGSELASRVLAIGNDIPCVISLARREFETWFLAAASSLAGCRGLPADIHSHPSPESLRDAKAWLSEKLGRKYNEINDQPAFASRFSLDEAAAVPSFRRLRSKLEGIFGGMQH